jgi:hypothetical protein
VLQLKQTVVIVRMKGAPVPGRVTKHKPSSTKAAAAAPTLSFADESAADTLARSRSSTVPSSSKPPLASVVPIPSAAGDEHDPALEYKDRLRAARAKAGVSAYCVMSVVLFDCLLS